MYRLRKLQVTTNLLLIVRVNCKDSPNIISNGIGNILIAFIAINALTFN